MKKGIDKFIEVSIKKNTDLSCAFTEAEIANATYHESLETEEDKEKNIEFVKEVATEYIETL